MCSAQEIWAYSESSSPTPLSYPSGSWSTLCGVWLRLLLLFVYGHGMFRCVVVLCPTALHGAVWCNEAASLHHARTGACTARVAHASVERAPSKGARKPPSTTCLRALAQLQEK